MAKNSDHALSFVSSFKGKSETLFYGHEPGLDPSNARPPEALDCGGCSAALGTNDAAPQSWEESQHSKACGARARARCISPVMKPARSSNARPPEALDCGGPSAALGTNDAAPQSWEESQHSKALRRVGKSETLLLRP
jgi:hypothetical protein